MPLQISVADLLAAWERGLRQSPLDRALTLLAVFHPELSIEEMARQSIGWRDSNLLSFRERVFGSEIGCLSRCPQCQESLEMNLETRDLRAEPAVTPDLSLAMPGLEIRLRLPDTQDLRAVAGLPPQQARQQLFGRCVMEARTEAGVIAIAALPEEAIDAAEQRMSAADPQADMRVAMSCPACGNKWHERFDILSFFWTELNVWARHIITEVHMLARAYGWYQDEILSLSPERRQIYLEMVGV